MWTDSPAGLLLPNMPSSGLNDVVRARVDPVSGRPVTTLPDTYQGSNSNPMQSDWSLSTAGLNVGGDGSCGLFDARTLPNGNILYCCGRDSSTANSETTGVAEIDPVTREIVWQWRDPAWVANNGPESAYKLNNGNYIVCDTDGTVNVSTTSHVYEITPDNVKVWSWFGGYRVNRIKPAYINGRYVIVLYSQSGVLVLDYETRTIVWQMLAFGLAGGTESTVNGGDFRKIDGVNYILSTLWEAAVPVVCLLNYDTQAVVAKVPTGTLAGYGPLDVQWLSDTTCIIATGNGAGTANGFFQIARPFDAVVIASSAPTTSRTMCCNVDVDTMQMTWCQNGPAIYSTNLGSVGWTQAATTTLTFTGASADIAYTGNDILNVDDLVTFSVTGGSLPTEIGTTPRYVKSVNKAGKTFQVCATLPSATAAALVPSTGGTGTPTATNTTIPYTGALQRVLDRINSRGPVLVAGYSKKLAAVSVRHGSIRLGDDPTGAVTGYVDYDYSNGILSLINAFNNVAGNVQIYTRNTTLQLDVPGLGVITQQKSTAVGAGSAVSVGMQVSSTATLGVFFGTGAPSFSAAKGSLYLNTTGSSTSTRAYVNTDGSTGWTNLTSAT